MGNVTPGLLLPVPHPWVSTAHPAKGITHNIFSFLSRKEGKLSFFLQKVHSEGRARPSRRADGRLSIFLRDPGCFLHLANDLCTSLCLVSPLCCQFHSSFSVIPTGTISWQGLVFPPPEYCPSPWFASFGAHLVLLGSKVGQECRRSHSLPAVLPLRGTGSRLRVLLRAVGVGFVLGGGVWW